MSSKYELARDRYNFILDEEYFVINKMEETESRKST